MIKHRRNLFIILLSSIIILALVGNIVMAATSSELKAQQAAKQGELNEAKKEQQEIRSQMSAVQKEVEDALEIVFSTIFKYNFNGLICIDDYPNVTSKW